MIKLAPEYKIELAPLCPQLSGIGLSVMNELMGNYDKDCVITCGAEGKHSRTSLHPVGRALDIRSRELSSLQQQQVKRGFDSALGEDFDIVIEKDHFHIEYQPKCKF